MRIIIRAIREEYQLRERYRDVSPGDHETFNISLPCRRVFHSGEAVRDVHRSLTSRLPSESPWKRTQREIARLKNESERWTFPSRRADAPQADECNEINKSSRKGKQEREGTISVDAKERHSRLLSDSGCVRVFYSLVRSRNADALLSQARNHRLALTKSRTPRGSWHAEPTGGVLYPLQLFPTPFTSALRSLARASLSESAT